VEYDIDVYIALQTVLFLDSPCSCCCTRIQPTANSYPNSLDITLHKLIAYPPGFGLLARFGHLSVDDRPNYGSNESLGMHAVAPKSEQQTMTPVQK
jgi:hypothetical protein